MLRVTFVCALMIALASFVRQDQTKSSSAGQPLPSDTDPQLTQELGQVEHQLADAAVHRDTGTLERLVGAEYALRIGDDPELSVPRGPWMDSLRPGSTSPYMVESFSEHYLAARRVADNLGVVSLLLTQKASASGRDRSGEFYLVDVWKKGGGGWQIIARYSTPVGKK